MNRFDFKAFFQKNRNLIWGILSFLFILNYCNRQASQPVRDSSVAQEQSVEETPVVQDGKSLKSYEELVRDRAQQQENRPSSFIITLILLAVGVFIAWQYQNRWKDKYFPGKVKFKAFRFRDKKTGRRLLRLMITNGSNESQTFMPPNIVFTRWGSQRQFKLKGSNSEDMFPLTLTPGTHHNVVIDLDQFFEKMPELKKFNRVGGSVSTPAGKSYRCFTAPFWMGI